MKDRFLDAIHRRSAALSRITHPNHRGREIDSVLAMLATNLFLTCAVAFGEDFSKQWHHKLFQSQARDYGLCPFCYENEFVDSLGMCQECSKQEEEVDREAECLAKMDEPPTGSVS